MKKVIIISCVLVLFSSSLVFSQSEKKGTVIGTFGLGSSFTTTVETKTLISMLFDLNLISRAGFTLCLTDVIGFNLAGYFSQNIMFGPGYHYMRNKWNIGGAVLFSPTAQDMIIAGKLDGGYYFTDNIGITGILTYGQTTGLGWDLSMFNIYTGISIKI